MLTNIINHEEQNITLTFKVKVTVGLQLDLEQKVLWTKHHIPEDYRNYA